MSRCSSVIERLPGARERQCLRGGFAESAGRHGGTGRAQAAWRAQPQRNRYLTVAPLMHRAPPMLTPEMLLGDALDVFVANRCKVLPVVSGHWSPVLVGEVSRHDLLLALQDRISERPERAARSEGAAYRTRALSAASGLCGADSALEEPHLDAGELDHVVVGELARLGADRRCR